MELKSERLSYQELSEKDIPFIHQLNSSEEVAQYNTIGIPTELSETQRIFQPILDDKKNEERSHYLWVIRDLENDFIGEIGLRLTPKRFKSGEIYYSLLPNKWGKGYATEAAKCVLTLCFDNLKLHRIGAGVAVDNKGSIRILEKLGMTLEGRHRKILPLKSGWSDNFEYAILEEDWEGN